MKKITLLSLVALSAALVGTTKVNAAEIETSKDKFNTDTTITIQDAGQDGEKDKLDPKDPTQTDLYIDSVPGSFDFSTKVMNKQYTIDSGVVTGDNKTINVFNNRIDRDWSVKAALVNDQITRKTDNTTYGVTEFNFNGVNVTSTGQSAIVAKAAETKTAANNTNVISTEVTGLSIKFNDAESALKAGDSLTGVIKYSLYNTPNGI